MQGPIASVGAHRRNVNQDSRIFKRTIASELGQCRKEMDILRQRRSGGAARVGDAWPRSGAPMALVDDTELMAATDWAIDGTLLDANGLPLDLSNATLQWTLIGPQGVPVLCCSHRRR